MASIMISSSMQLLFTGGQVDWMMNTSMPRTFSLISTLVSPSLKVATLAFPRETPRFLQIFPARSRLELPEKILIRSSISLPPSYWLNP